MKKVKVDVPAVQDKAVYFQLRDVGTQLNELVENAINSPTITVGTDEPTSPEIGDLWVDTN